MFLELLSKAHIRSIQIESAEIDAEENISSTNEEDLTESLSIRIDIFKVQIMQYPRNWDIYDGIVIPGSVHSAADTTQEWISTLKQIIHDEIHSKYRKTLGICFGHQILANYLDNNNVIPCPSGSQVGIVSSSVIKSTADEKKCHPFEQFNINPLKLFCTHGDMVCNLPANATPLAQSMNVPYQSIAYHNPSDNEYYAFSFQAHLEYATSPFGKNTYRNVINMMETKKHISKDVANKCIDDMNTTINFVNEQSVQLALIVGRTLGWF